MKEEEKTFYQEVLRLLDALQERYNGDDIAVSAILQVALSCHLHECKDYRLTDSCFHYLQGSFNDLYSTLMPQGTTAEGSSALH
jgi:hypothetical protein